MKLVAQIRTDSPQAEQIRTQYPDVELIELTDDDPPAGLKADAFFGGYMQWDVILRWLETTGVQWVQLTGTGIDNVPRAAFDGRTVTCARGASAVPISEWVMAAILAWAKRMPETFLSDPPKYWNFPNPPLDRLEGSQLAIVGLGG